MCVGVCVCVNLQHFVKNDGKNNIFRKSIGVFEIGMCVRAHPGGGHSTFFR